MKKSPSNNNKFANIYKTLSGKTNKKKMRENKGKEILNAVENFVYGSRVASVCLTKDRKLSQSKQTLFLLLGVK